MGYSIPRLFLGDTTGWRAHALSRWGAVVFTCMMMVLDIGYCAGVWSWTRVLSCPSDTELQAPSIAVQLRQADSVPSWSGAVGLPTGGFGRGDKTTPRANRALARGESETGGTTSLASWSFVRGSTAIKQFRVRPGCEQLARPRLRVRISSHILLRCLPPTVPGLCGGPVVTWEPSLGDPLSLVTH